jgi:F-type H+-transporting ATPase subunit delta
LRNPIVNIHTKQAALEKMFAGNLSMVTMLLLKKLADSRREKYIGEIATAFVHEYKKMNKVVIAEVISASKLDDKLREEVKQIVRKNPEFAGASAIELEEKVDKNIIGGLIIRVEDKQVDASFARQIKDFRRSFEENPYVKEF